MHILILTRCAMVGEGHTQLVVDRIQGLEGLHMLEEVRHRRGVVRHRLLVISLVGDRKELVGTLGVAWEVVPHEWCGPLHGALQ